MSKQLRFTIHASILATLCALGLCDISDGHCAEHTFILNIESMAGKGLCAKTRTKNYALLHAAISESLPVTFLIDTAQGTRLYSISSQWHAGKGLSR